LLLLLPSKEWIRVQVKTAAGFLVAQLVVNVVDAERDGQSARLSQDLT
jgi:hypothetical protein